MTLHNPHFPANSMMLKKNRSWGFYFEKPSTVLTKLSRQNYNHACCCCTEAYIYFFMTKSGRKKKEKTWMFKENVTVLDEKSVTVWKTKEKGNILLKFWYFFLFDSFCWELKTVDQEIKTIKETLRLCEITSFTAFILKE